MNKPMKKLQPIQPVASVPAETQKPVEKSPVPALVRDDENRIIKPERFCPICWEKNRGYGVAYSTSSDGTRYYRCKHSADDGCHPCGFTWSVSPQEIEAARKRFQDYLSSVIVEHQEIVIDQTRAV